MGTPHGFEACTACKDLFTHHDRDGPFERWGQGEPVRLINNPASWGATEPRYYLLGFSKGNTQNKALAEAKMGRAKYEDVPFKGMRKRLGWLLKALGIDIRDGALDRIFMPTETRVQSASLVRCSISARTASGGYSYKLGDIIEADKAASERVREVIRRCVGKHLTGALDGTSFILLGLDEDQIQWTRDAFEEQYGPLHSPKPTVYRNDQLSWVHVAHPSGSQTDPQYQRWCSGETSTAKVVWARSELDRRRLAGGN